MQYSDIGKYVRKKRKELPKSLSDFAVECEIEPAALSRFERGFGDVCFQNFIKIAKGFNESPAEFLKEFENSPCNDVFIIKHPLSKDTAS